MATSVTLRFYAELNDFLPDDRRQRTVAHPVRGAVSVKDLIESLGVPHTEVALVLMDQEPTDFSALVRGGARIAVYPVFRRLDVADLVSPRTAGPIRFVLDTHLGRLAGYLRLAGFDTLYRNDIADPTLAEISRHEGRTLLTRDRELLKRRVLTEAYWVRETAPRGQFVEVLRRFNLLGELVPFTRCLRCNAPLRSVPKAQVAHRLPPRTRLVFDDLFECSGCNQLYWKGSHFSHMEDFLRGVVAEASGLVHQAARSPGAST